MRATRSVIVFITAVTMTAACGSRPMPAGPTSASPAALASAEQTSSGGGGGTVKEPLSGPAINGVVPQVTFDFKPVGAITLSHGEGTLATSLGHFGVSRDQVRVNNGGTTILTGGFFS